MMCICGIQYFESISTACEPVPRAMCFVVAAIALLQVSCPGGYSHGKANNWGDKNWPNRGLKEAESTEST